MPTDLQFRILTQKAEMLPLCPLIQQSNADVTADYYAAMLDEMLPYGYRMVDGMRRQGMFRLVGYLGGGKDLQWQVLKMDNVVIATAHRSRYWQVAHRFCHRPGAAGGLRHHDARRVYGK